LSERQKGGEQTVSLVSVTNRIKSVKGAYRLARRWDKRDENKKSLQQTYEIKG